MGFTGILLLQLMTLLEFLEGSMSWAMENKTFTLSSNCPKACGDIKIEYPFGIGNDCFLAPGFNLTCSHDHSNPPKLLLGDGTLQVRNFSMEKGLVYIESPYVTLNTDVQSVDATLINLKNLPLSFDLLLVYFTRRLRETSDNSLYVIGCDVTANIVDVVTGGTLDACSTVCSTINTSTAEQRFTYGNGYCILNLYFKESWDIQLIRLNETENKHYMLNNNTSDVTAILLDQEFIYYDDDEFERLTNYRNITGFTASLSWYISDHTSCKEAAKRSETYACRSQKSECYDVVAHGASYWNEPIGYTCQCSLDYVGNPYLPNGCQLDQNFTLTPAKDCQAKCGNVAFFFPFGIKEGCYRDKGFALTCNETSHPPTLLYPDYYGVYYAVSKISLQEGQLEYTSLSDYYEYYSYDRFSHFTSMKDQSIINWVVANKSCKDATKEKITFACIDEHSICLDVNDTGSSQFMGYRCNCLDGYQGNPYLHDGCQDIDECKSSMYVCNGICINIEGDFNCTCPPGTSGDPLHGACIPHGKKNLLLGVLLGASIGTSLLLLCISSIFLTRKWKLQNQRKIRQRNFHKNHGLLLQQLMSTSEHVEEKTNIFSLEEIEKATNNFDETRILGRGGHGTVYKGILSDQRVVAIKKSKTVKRSEIDQFINEVAVLSQINHRNVVKLLGCCLETDVPLLIYEFISNGTLSYHLHVSQGESKLSWNDRLRIATESASALAYLHSAASISIFHRDVKSTNILLDDTFRAKVSDFGASRFIPIDQTHIVTAIHGTFGYLDPEYYHTSQLTEKSDVYSFGVILLELLTGKKPVNSTNDGSQQNLAMNFLQATTENMLFDLIEDLVLHEGTKQELLEISSLIKICLSLKGAERPTMKEVEYKLQGIRKTRMKKRETCISEGNEETECLLSMSSYSSSELIDQIDQGNSRNYSLEKELMWSQNYPR